jgi:hypothetical protein
MPCADEARQLLTEVDWVVSVGSGEDAADAIKLVCPRRLARPRTPPFHGDNMSSNLIGDTKVSMGALKLLNSLKIEEVTAVPNPSFASL